jgi:hypothetical protein
MLFKQIKMETFNDNDIYNAYDNMNANNSFFYFSKDKDPPWQHINLSENYEDQFGYDYNEPYNKNSYQYNSLSRQQTKETIEKNKNKDNDQEKIKQIKTEESHNNYPVQKEKNGTQKKSLLGRKRKEDSGSGEHNKFSDDNLRRKCKHLVLDSAFNFINDKIKEKYNGNIGNGRFVKQLLILNHKQKSDASIKFNKEFLHKNLGDIFSEKISSRYTSYNPYHNKCLIKLLTCNEDEDKKSYFSKLFSIAFVDCLRHFRGSKKIEELEGMIGFDNIKSKYENDADYLKSLDYYIMNYEEIMNNKRIRKEDKKN